MSTRRARRSARKASAVPWSRFPTSHAIARRLERSSPTKAYASPSPAACSAGVTRACFFPTYDQDLVKLHEGAREVVRERVV